MEYSVQKLARLAGVSTRTLRYYDEIGLLKPARINASGYRVYGPPEVDRLQQILFYRQLDVGLKVIKEIVTAPSFDAIAALKSHRDHLLRKRKQLDLLLANVERTIAEKEGRIKMTDGEKFRGFKKKLVEDNERKYGAEIREKYGTEAVERSNARLLNMTPEEYEEVTRLEKEYIGALHAAMKTGDPAGELAQKAADLHRRWLSFYWDSYSKEAHAGLAQMYVDDERFRSYFDREQPGTAEFLRDAVLIYTGVKS
jgi:DNA-binding transcriptional MerR regulator